MESLFEVETSVPFDVMVIDNKSHPQELKLIEDCYRRLVGRQGGQINFITNQKNTGYSAANNLGIQFAFDHQDRYSHLCLLNNDTIVTPYWLERLIAHTADGLVGPVTNIVGNEQRVPVDYALSDDLNSVKHHTYRFAEKWHETHRGSSVQTWMLGFFCVFGKTSTYQKIGLLDEKFGIGTYEDDDYCHRARALNIELIIARDVFIHHWGSASFSKLKQLFFHQLMERNRKYYEAKNQSAWRNPATTTFEGYRNEVLWNFQHDSPISRNALEYYETIIKHQIRAGQEMDTLLRGGKLWRWLDLWGNSNVPSSKVSRTMVLLFACILSLFDREATSSRRSILNSIKAVWVAK